MDPENRRHTIRLLGFFEHRNHLCFVFEPMAMNLRDVLKKFGKNVGISLDAVRAYSKQLFYSLQLMLKCDVIHADLKPDNILVS
jgi:serine/threonine-protein kinase PRP4